jgi:Cohesin domain
MVFRRRTLSAVNRPQKLYFLSPLLIIPLTFFLLAISSAKGGIQLTLDPASAQVDLGGTTDLFVGINGLGDPPSLSAYDLTVNFDPTLFSFAGISFGDPSIGNQLNLSGFGTITSENAGLDFINFSEVSLDSAETLDTMQASSFVLVDLEFQALNNGIGTFSIANTAVLGDSSGNPLTASSLGTAAIQAGTGGSATPEPYMFLPSLMALAALYFGNRSRFRRI